MGLNVISYLLVEDSAALIIGVETGFLGTTLKFMYMKSNVGTHIAA
jgi:hypothetical protein